MTEYPLELRFHHVGFVVTDITSSMAGFLHSLMAKWDGQIYEDPLQQVKVAFLTTFPGDGLIELVQPMGESSPVSRFLAQRHGGLHHVCYEVKNLEACLTSMKTRGSRLVKRPKPAVAFQQRRIAWMLTAENLLVEFLERETVPASAESGSST